MESEKIEGPKTLGQRSKEPIFSTRQLIVLIASIMYTVIFALYDVLFFDGKLTVITIANIGINILFYGLNAILRATHTELVPDNSKVEALKKFALEPLKKFAKRAFSALYSTDDKFEGLNLLEKIIHLAVNEWDLINNDELSDVNEFFKIGLESEKKKES